MTNAIVRVRWIRVVVAGVPAEAVLTAIAIPVTLWVGQTPLLYIIPPACFLATLFFGRWAANKAGENFILHGTLVRIVLDELHPERGVLFATNVDTRRSDLFQSPAPRSSPY